MSASLFPRSVARLIARAGVIVTLSPDRAWRVDASGERVPDRWYATAELEGDRGDRIEPANCCTSTPRNAVLGAIRQRAGVESSRAAAARVSTGYVNAASAYNLPRAIEASHRKLVALADAVAGAWPAGDGS